ncbi:cysteine-rich secretory protein LCCL domain-containing 2-like [Ostrea edulis]|uniref:cysteine-rich secretory protein LCCL domain-containing 2-like n=1 Tax=Ostrea edulis TaxID=37623 RepID=UPI0024AED624|nr:cysteine-rich secretory protein LCCL domain-containing 2-like [Ostrea edulis]
MWGFNVNVLTARVRRRPTPPNIAQSENLFTKCLQNNMATLLGFEPLEKRGVLSGDAAAFLKAHNDKRRIVSPTATDMKEMQWSTELERIARNYAKKCTFAHNSQRSSSTSYYVGENLFVSYGDMSPAQAVTSWDNEKNDYTLSSNRCDPNSKHGCGHYTQVVWANSETVGCVKHFCNYVRNFNNRGYLVVCNYGPGGNVNNRRPYTSGTTCKDCPAGYTCVNKLCSKSSGGGGSNPCSTNPCKNSGTCTSSGSGNAVCKCTNGWSGSTCETRDRSFCSQNPCKNGGTCWNLNNRFLCRCPPSYSGTRCETGQRRTGPESSFSCNFERGMCLKNYRKNEVNFRRLSFLRMNRKTISAPEGSSFAVVYAGFIFGQKNSYLLSNYLPEAVTRVTFTYRIVGSGELKFIYKNKDINYPKSVFSSKSSNGVWKSWTVTIPSGKKTYYYFQATVGRNSVIGIDNIKVKVYQ